ncbi:MAG TPA: cytochrome c maturation protein CcmE [Actinomycetota bacterium]|jgi:cytochrome c-type biogenesis protein CcmE
MDQPLQIETGPSPKRRAKFLAGGAVIALVLVLLVAWAMTRADAMASYMTTSELVAEGPTLPGEKVDVNGKVTEGSVVEDGLETSFEITDGVEEVQITTDVDLPDAFRSGADVVAHGTFDGSLFTADKVLAKCPSKFKPASD